MTPVGVNVWETGMGIEAFTHRDDGSKGPVPVTRDDWDLWVSAGRTRNWVLQDPLVDWLQRYGRSRNYVPKQELPDYDEDLDFVRFIFEKGREFEAGILRLLEERYEVTTVSLGYEDIRSLDKAEETFAAMRRGDPIIYQPVLWDAQNLTYGSPDFLLRSDVLHHLFPTALSDQDTETNAPDLGDNPWHYRVVDVKFTTLSFNAAGTELANGGSATAYKAQLYVYNRMLGRLQGLEPPESYLLGRGWRFTSKGVDYRGDSAMDRLAPIPQNGTVTYGVPIAHAVEQALDWVRRVRTEGRDWELLPTPSIPELYPNMGGVDDDMMRDSEPADLEGDDEDGLTGRWENVKKWLANELKELTLLWQVGVGKRKEAHSRGFYRWDDPRLTPPDVGVKGAKLAPILQRLLDVNRNEGPPVLPRRIDKTRDDWFSARGIEFYVDFEFCSDLNDDFSNLPEKGGQTLIFMIGCGHVENGQWQFKSLVAGSLSEDEEARIIREWFDHMSKVRDRLDPENPTPRIFHWSSAEISALRTAYNSAWNRHNQPSDWPDLGWYDFLQSVMRQEPVVVRGALGFGLKAVANAMHSQHLIETNWSDSPVDGLGAMVGAWRCDEKTQLQGEPMSTSPLMAEIARYNEVDCKVMMEIVRYLRANH